MDSIILVTTEWAVHTEYIDDNSVYSEIMAVHPGGGFWRCSRYNLN